MSPCSEKERAMGGCARQAEASALQDHVGNDSKTETFKYLSKDLELSLSFSWDVLCVFILRHA